MSFSEDQERWAAVHWKYKSHIIRPLVRELTDMEGNEWELRVTPIINKVGQQGFLLQGFDGGGKPCTKEYNASIICPPLC